MQSLGVGLTPHALEGMPESSPLSLLGTMNCCVPGSYLQSGSVEYNALSQTHPLAYGHPLPNGDIGPQLWRRGSCFESGGTWGHNGFSKAGRQTGP